MGMLNSGGQGANAFAQNFMNMYNAGQDRQLRGRQIDQQKILQDAQIQEYLARAAERKRQTENENALRGELSGLFKPQTAQDMAFNPDAVSYRDVAASGDTEGYGGPQRQIATLTPEGQGLMGGKPSLDSYLNVLGKYKPEQALTARVSLQNNEERLKSQQEILALKQDQALKLFGLTQDMRYKQAADKAASDMDLLMERMQGLRDIQGIKNEGKTVKEPGILDMVRLKKMISDVGDNPGEGDIMLINDAAEKLGYQYEKVPGGAYHRELFGMQIPGSKGREPNTYKLVPIGNQGKKTGTTPKKPLSAFGR